MTRVFVYEYTCAAPPASLEVGGAASLCAEGAAMLQAVLTDLRRVPGVDAYTILREPDEEAAFRAAVRRSDWSLVIAPEFDEILLKRCRWVLEEGGRLLGPSPDAVELCGDKLALCRKLDSCGVRVPEMRPVGTGNWHGAFVRKPRFGAGSQNTHLIQPGSIEPQGRSRELVEEAFVPGLAASVAFLIGQRRHVPLHPCWQRLSDDGRFQYLGGRVPLPPNLAERALVIAGRAVAKVAGLFGYVGVDVVLGDDGRDWIIEINPRLTTSYVGLRTLAETNLADLMLHLADDREPAPLTWRDGAVEFSREGQTEFFASS